MSVMPQEIYGHKEHVGALLEYIETTGRLIRWNQTMASMAISESARLLPAEATQHFHTAAIAHAEAVINQELYELQGIPHYFDDTDSGQRIPCLLTRWLGIDPKADEHHLWGVEIGQGGGVVSLTTTMYDEIRSGLKN